VTLCVEKRMCWIALIAILLIVLGGCGQNPLPNQASPTVEKMVIVASFTPEVILDATVEPSPTFTLTPQATFTKTPLPTFTPTPTSEAILIGPFVPFEDYEKQSLGAIFDLASSPNGTLWLITSQGLSSTFESTWIVHPEHGDIVLGFDELGRTWVTTKDGETASAWNGEDWKIYALESGWTPAGPVFRSGPYATVSEDIVTDERGWVWLATQQDVRRFDGEQWRIYDPDDVGYYPTEDMIEQGYAYLLTDMAIDSVGDVWIADCAWMGPGPDGQGARWFTGRYWWGRSSQVVSSGCVEDIEVDETGRIWVGVDETLWRYTPRWGWNKFIPPKIDPSWGPRWGYITEIELGGQDIVWVTITPCEGASCDSGLFLVYRVINGEWTLVSDNGPGDLALDSDGNGWWCVDNSLYNVIDESVNLVADLNPFYCTVELDTNGRSWLALPGQSTLWYLDKQNNQE